MKYFLERQKRNYFCMVACLQAILLNKGIKLSQEKFAVETNCTEEGILDICYVRNFLEKNCIAFYYFRHNEVPFKEYDFLLSISQADILIARPTPAGLHTYLLEEFKYPKLSVINPNSCRIEEIHLPELIDEMIKNGGGFGLTGKLF